MFCRPDLEVVRTEGLDRSEQMISRLGTRLHFLEREEGSHHSVFLDTDMLVVKNHGFDGEEPLDVAATGRHSRRDPVNGDNLKGCDFNLKGCDFNLKGCDFNLGVVCCLMATHSPPKDSAPLG